MAGLDVVGQTQDIVCRGLVEFGQTNQNISGDIPQTTFIAAVLGLLHTQVVRYLLLGHVVIFPEVFQTGIVIVHCCANFHNRLVLTWYHNRGIIQLFYNRTVIFLNAKQRM